MRKNNFNKIYGQIGKIFCGVAGGIVGFVIGGVLLAILGVGVGAIAGHLLERKVAKA